jgi:hypothetical protein
VTGQRLKKMTPLEKRLLRLDPSSQRGVLRHLRQARFQKLIASLKNQSAADVFQTGCSDVLGKILAIVDTGCTRTCVEVETFENIREALKDICPELPQVDESRPFRGVGGNGVSLYAVFLPVGLEGQVFWLRASVLPGCIPLLLSRRVVQSLGLNIMLDDNTLSTRDGSWKVPLVRLPKGHLGVDIKTYPPPTL